MPDIDLGFNLCFFIIILHTSIKVTFSLTGKLQLLRDYRDLQIVNEKTFT